MVNRSSKRDTMDLSHSSSVARILLKNREKPGAKRSPARSVVLLLSHREDAAADELSYQTVSRHVFARQTEEIFEEFQ